MNITTDINNIPKNKGSYILFIVLEDDLEVKIGSLGSHKLKQGSYLYIGSALGPGGLRARIRRHLTKTKNLHWHIDYLTKETRTKIKYVIYIETTRNIECNITQILTKHKNFKAIIKGFGSTDCKKRCISHFLICLDKPYKCLEKTYNILKEHKYAPRIMKL